MSLRPEAGFRIPAATYLAWVDLAPYVPTGVNLTSFIARRTGVLVEGGEKFVADGGDCIRLNLACPRAQVEEAMSRIVEATLELAHGATA